jgi:hypothetical protein
MIYLIDPQEVYGNTDCQAVANHILYGIPPCPLFCWLYT